MTGSSAGAGQYEISDACQLPASPLVSVMLLAYNHSAYLASAIDSVLSQDVPFSIELLIGEDCSTDDSGQIALRYQRANPQRVRIISADRNVGGHENWRRLLVASRGPYVAHLDGDDYWLPGKLRRQIRFLQEEPDCIAVYANARTIADDGRVIGVFNDVGQRTFSLADLVERGNILNTSSMVFRASCKRGLLDVNAPILDYGIHLRLARLGRVVQLAETMVVYRINSSVSAVTHSNDRVRELYWQAILDVPRDSVSSVVLAKGIADFYRRVLFRAVGSGRWSLAREWAPRVFAEAPCGRLAMLANVGMSVLRTLWRILWGRVLTWMDSRRPAVLHRR